MPKILRMILLAAGTVLSALAASEPQLLRVTYHSKALNADREAFVYLPPDFEKQDKWPVILFLHGNGERGDGRGELDYVLKHGPLFEAWCQRRDLPFVIISPQLPMYDQAGVDYIKNRTRAEIPLRKMEGANPYPWHPRSTAPMDGQLGEPATADLENYPRSANGWNTVADDSLALVERVLAEFRGDSRRVYLTGISQGGKGVWDLAARFPDRFAAVAPVVGSGAPALAAPIARARLPVWAFAGGRDATDNRVKYFYPILNELEKLGHREVRFTIEADLGHDAWMRVYAGQDLYAWFLKQSK